MNELLKDIPLDNISIFKKDLFLLINIVNNIDIAYGNAKIEFIHDLVHFKRFIEEWNQKYPDLIINYFDNGIQFKIRILINEPDLKSLFINSAGNIEGLRAINNTNIEFKNNEYLDKLTEIMKTEMNLLCIDEENNENTLTFKHNDKNNKIELIFEKTDMLNPESPEFKICAYYALKQHKPEIDLQEHGTNFSFDTAYETQKGEGFGYERRRPLFNNFNK
ncbi:hypothetical protein JXB41_07880 [Candidatus Woesearchaeota archaeon]|nr:hypothetical protein [Candidatus Woesearchaeota archaeon]